MRQILKNATIVTMDPARRVLTKTALIVENGKITGLPLQQGIKAKPNDRIIDLTGRFILPGLINSHVHTVQHLGRGLSDDVDILTWLHKRIWPYEANLTPHDSYLNTMLCGVEQIQNGVTTIADAGIHHAGQTVRAINDLGLRAMLCYSIMDIGRGLPKAWRLKPKQAIDFQKAAYREFHGALDGRIHWWFGLRTLMNNSDELLRRTVRAAEESGTWVHMHVAEGPAEVEVIGKTRGCRTVPYLEKFGLLGPKFLAVHCVATDRQDWELFSKRQVKVSHNPAAALRVMGLAPISEMVEEGVVVSIATDGAPSNCRNSLIDEMFLASLLQKGRTFRPEALPATKILEMVTIDAARCLGLEAEIGSIEVGKRADLAVINPQTANMLPLHDPISNFVFSMQTRNFESVMADGKWLMRNHKISHINVPELLETAQKAAMAVRKRAGIKLPNRFNWC